MYRDMKTPRFFLPLGKIPGRGLHRIGWVADLDQDAAGHGLDRHNASYPLQSLL
jgi:hypothetical protein